MDSQNQLVINPVLNQNSDVNFIIDMFYSYGVGYCDVFWSSSDDRNVNEWLEIASITNGYLKITTLLPPS